MKLTNEEMEALVREVEKSLAEAATEAAAPGAAASAPTRAGDPVPRGCVTWVQAADKVARAAIVDFLEGTMCPEAGFYSVKRNPRRRRWVPASRLRKVTSRRWTSLRTDPAIDLAAVVLADFLSYSEKQYRLTPRRITVVLGQIRDEIEDDKARAEA